MKIAHIVCTYPPYYGGMGSVVFQTASALAKRGHAVEVFTPQYYRPEEIKPKEAPPEIQHEPEVEERIDYARRLTPSFAFGNAARMPQLKYELDAFDVVHLHYPFFGTAGLVASWKRRHPDRPLIVTYHMDTRGPGWKGLIFKLYSRFWMPRILGAADKLIASSFDYLGSSDASALYGAHPEKWVELPFGVDLNRFHPAESRNQKSTILFVGGMDAAHYFKGVPVLLNALSMLKDQKREKQALLVGDGELRAGFELQAKALGLGNTVRFAGAVSEIELPEYYRSADLLVLPSISRGEAFGMVLLEAFASGVPVVATDLPGVRAVASDGGVVVPPNDAAALAQAIAEFFVDDVRRRDLSASVRQLAEKRYAWGPIAQELEGIYQSLVQ